MINPARRRRFTASGNHEKSPNRIGPASRWCPTVERMFSSRFLQGATSDATSQVCYGIDLYCHINVQLCDITIVLLCCKRLNTSQCDVKVVVLSHHVSTALLQGGSCSYSGYFPLGDNSHGLVPF